MRVLSGRPRNADELTEQMKLQSSDTGLERAVYHRLNEIDKRVFLCVTEHPRILRLRVTRTAPLA